jgi:hypothetical protein
MATLLGLGARRLTGAGIHSAASMRFYSTGKPDFRPMFTDFLKTPPPESNWVAFGVVKQMNNQMVREGVAMSEEHYKVAIDSLSKGSTICEFLQAENTHVLSSEGTGCVYSAGKLFHQAVYFTKNSASKE